MSISAQYILLIFFLSSVLFSLAYIAFKVLKKSRKQRIEKMPDETGEPHACLPNSFSPLSVVQSKAFEIGGGKHEILMFRGLYCSTCGRELCCESCGRTPGYGAMLVSHDEGERWSHCCQPPKWALRYGGKTLAPDERAPLLEKTKEDPLRWN